jgi:cytoskeletal protein RodZ
MQSVGIRLRQARVEQKQTLEEISGATRISLKNLTAIESDGLAKFSSPFIYRSFVRQYAQALKVDYASLAPDVQAAAGAMPQPLIPGQEAEPPPVRSGLTFAPRVQWDFRWIYPVASLVLVVVACSILYGIWGHEPKIPQIPQTVSASSVPAPPATQQVAHQIPAAPRVATPPIAAATPIHIELSATEPTWLSMVADGKETFSGVLDTAATKTLEGRDRARIRMGNAGGVSVLFNGKTLGALGKRGEVRTIEFTKAGYREIVPAPAPAADIALPSLSPSGE